MGHEKLQTATDLVESAAQDTDGEASERLSSLADQLAAFASGEKAADHGLLARIQSGLHEVEDDVDEATVETINDALDAINAHRETLDGV